MTETAVASMCSSRAFISIHLGRLTDMAEYLRTILDTVDAARDVCVQDIIAREILYRWPLDGRISKTLNLSNCPSRQCTVTG